VYTIKASSVVKLLHRMIAIILFFTLLRGVSQVDIPGSHSVE